MEKIIIKYEKEIVYYSNTIENLIKHLEKNQEEEEFRIQYLLELSNLQGKVTILNEVLVQLHELNKQMVKNENTK